MPLGPNQTRFVDALRSGFYHQGRKYLFDPQTETFCALGVAANLFAPQADTVCLAPAAVIEKLALRDNVGSPADESTQLSIAGMNDIGYSFDHIANVLTEHSEIYFTRVA